MAGVPVDAHPRAEVELGLLGTKSKSEGETGPFREVRKGQDMSAAKARCPAEIGPWVVVEHID